MDSCGGIVAEIIIMTEAARVLAALLGLAVHAVLDELNVRSFNQRHKRTNPSPTGQSKSVVLFLPLGVPGVSAEVVSHGKVVPYRAPVCTQKLVHLALFFVRKPRRSCCRL